jgi:hypothetical protein
MLRNVGDLGPRFRGDDKKVEAVVRKDAVQKSVKRPLPLVTDCLLAGYICCTATGAHARQEMIR